MFMFPHIPISSKVKKYNPTKQAKKKTENMSSQVLPIILFSHMYSVHSSYDFLNNYA